MKLFDRHTIEDYPRYKYIKHVSEKRGGFKNKIMEKKTREMKVEKIATTLRGDFVLLGYSVNDDRFDNGKSIQTSKLVKIDFEKKIAETKNTIYKFTLAGYK